MNNQYSMEFLKKNFPILFSPKFWGIFLYTVLEYLQVKGFVGGEEINLLSQLVALATGVGLVDSVARKIGGIEKK